ncbi:MAG TPA: hypothetical protein VEK57_26115 [Thermoanaerobaculia bacterium]|nr:hypothetical protein [Thermoanaerobaculia bacterium]
MQSPKRQHEIDTLLDPTPPSKRQQRIETLIVAFARPIMDRIIARFLYSESLQREDADDIVATVTLRLFTKLTDSGDAEPIRKFDEYVATLTYNAIHDYRRRRYPERTRLKNRLRYIASTDDRLAMWNTPAGTAVGLAESVGQPGLEKIDFGISAASPAMLDQGNPASAIVEVVRAVGAPITLDTLAGVLELLWGTTEQNMLPEASLIDETPNPLERLELRESIGTPWQEVFDLRRTHRNASRSEPLGNVAEERDDPLAALRADFERELAVLGKRGAPMKLRRVFSSRPAKIARAANDGSRKR